MSAAPAIPPWLKRSLPSGARVHETGRVLDACGVNTVCRSAKCPNLGDCFSRRTATFMINGRICTRNCRFCGVAHGTPLPPDDDEPCRVAEAAVKMGLRHVVVTSVTRDDLTDGGACQFKRVVEALREQIQGATIELLVPDFQGKTTPLETVISLNAQVFNHNLETVRRLTPQVRSNADYDRSLRVLAAAARLGRGLVKTGLMLGLGETRDELSRAFGEMAEAGCRILTLGQYLRPGRECMEVVRYLSPEEFGEIREEALAAGLRTVFAGPWVRSSFHAEEAAAAS